MRTNLLVGTVVLGVAAAVATPVLGTELGGAFARAFGGASVGSAQHAGGDGAGLRAASAAAVVPAPAASVLFNDPTGDVADQDRIAGHVRRAIDATPRHGTIRMAAYSFDRHDIVEALRRACTRRQVTVQVVVNDNFVSPPVRRLRRLLGADRDSSVGVCDGSGRTSTEPSFVKVCRASCRLGDRGNQHMKFYLFSGGAGTADVVMLGSANLTGYAAGVHWNDLVTFTGDRQLYDDYGRVFAELSADRLVDAPALDLTHGDVMTSVSSGRPADADDDAVAQRLARIDCRALPGSGVAGRTVLRISMYGWRGARGADLARRVAGLRAQGCRVQALVSAAGPEVVEILLAGGVRVRSASLDVDDNVATGFESSGWEYFVHEKWMSVDGTWDGSATRAVWTGSENWSDVSHLNDELVVMIPRAGIHAAYVAHFDGVWADHSVALGPLASAM
ncbi:phospholipase D-like domain-containing protein [Nocardioides sp. GCM10028917]|uniref:phospholipase D-like domain-containing protein n=1 Tax=Nocardioides sp. GCM10028917 TaxID=3273408 RepID=UPI003622EB33